LIPAGTVTVTRLLLPPWVMRTWRDELPLSTPPKVTAASSSW